MMKAPAAIFTALASAMAVGLIGAAQSSSSGGPEIAQIVRNRVQQDGSARVIVQLNLATGAHVPEGRLPNAAIARQRNAIRAAHARLMAKLPRGGHRIVREFQTVPYVALEIGPAALAALEAAAGDAVRVLDDELARPSLADRVPLVQGDQ